MNKPSSLVIVLVVVAAIVFGWHYFTAHAVDPVVLGQIRPGMKWEEVKKLVPTDQEARKIGTGERMVAIRKHDRWCMVDVFVDEEGKVVSWFHDH